MGRRRRVRAGSARPGAREGGAGDSAELLPASAPRERPDGREGSPDAGRLPDPSDSTPSRAAAASGWLRRRCGHLRKMFNVESVERVELCESLLTWVRGGQRAGGETPQPFADTGARPGGRAPGATCRHIRGLGRAELRNRCGRVYTRGRVRVSRERPGSGRLGPGSRRNLSGLRCWLLSERKPARWGLMMGCRRHCN